MDEQQSELDERQKAFDSSFDEILDHGTLFAEHGVAAASSAGREEAEEGAPAVAAASSSTAAARVPLPVTPGMHMAGSDEEIPIGESGPASSGGEKRRRGKRGSGANKKAR